MVKKILLGLAMTVCIGGVMTPVVKADCWQAETYSKQAEQTRKQAEQTRLQQSVNLYYERKTTGNLLNSYDGVFYYKNHKETYYNLDMTGVIEIMRNQGYSEEEYDFWVRDDGVKMLGNYVMVAADLSIYPRGSLIETSVGRAIVCDTGDFIYTNPYQIDVAVRW